MTSTDDRGYVKYWQANLNNVHTFQAHNDPVRASRWDDSIPSSVLLVVFISNDKSNIADKLYHFHKNDKVYYQQSWCSIEMHAFLLRYNFSLG